MEETPLTIGILVVSDTRSPSTDDSGPAVRDALTGFGFDRTITRICKDEVALIKTNLLELVESCCVIFTSGGTGFSHRDVTPEATLQIIEKQANSVSELIRLRGLERTQFSHLSRGVSGVRGKTLVVNLPGSPSGARDGVEAIGHLLVPIISTLTGRSCPVPNGSV